MGAVYLAQQSRPRRSVAVKVLMPGLFLETKVRKEFLLRFRREADALARDAITARGFGVAFGHSLGHGLGLEVHEAPRLAVTAEAPLPVGAVVTVEPGIYVDGRFGIRIEDDVFVTEDGCENPVQFTKELLEVG